MFIVMPSFPQASLSACLTEEDIERLLTVCLVRWKTFYTVLCIESFNWLKLSSHVFYLVTQSAITIILALFLFLCPMLSLWYAYNSYFLTVVAKLLAL